MDNENQSIVKSSDLYECAFYLCLGCVVREIQIITENKKVLCIMFMTGENILNFQQIYFRSEAIVNLFDFRRSYGRLVNLIALAKKRQKDNGGAL